MFCCSRSLFQIFCAGLFQEVARSPASDSLHKCTQKDGRQRVVVEERHLGINTLRQVEPMGLALVEARTSLVVSR